MRRKVILIGGMSHRREYYVDHGQKQIKIPHPMPMFPVSLKDYHSPEPHTMKFDTYIENNIHFGGLEPIPNIFFLEGTDPMLWAKNIILDYVK